MTATDTRCIHEMLPGQCSICSKHPEDRLYERRALRQGRRVRVDAADVEARSEATFPNRCPGCRNWIRAGDPIVLSSDLDLWVCESCGEGS